MTARKKKSFMKTLSFVLCIIIAVPVLLLIFFAFSSRKMADLEIWHTTRLINEFTMDSYREGYTFEDYRKQEDLLFEELTDRIYDHVPATPLNRLNRFNRESICFPGNYSRDWNRSFELIPSNIKGGVLLIHGLSDAPYSMKHVAEFFYSKGFYTLGLRVPGHGTIPAQLNYVTRHDWITAATIAARQVRKMAGRDMPFYLCGYSNGAPISLGYTLDALDDPALPVPDKIFLFSPSIGVTKLAVLSRWLSRLSFIPYFQKSKWKDILPEYNPFKYSSFTMKASHESHLLTTEIQQRIDTLMKNNRSSELPPIVTFQSIVDATTKINDLIFQLYYKLSPKNNELVIFSVNENAGLEIFINQGYRNVLDTLMKPEKTPFNITIVTNKSPDSLETTAKQKPENDTVFTDKDLNASWPRGIYSLSHIALLFPPDDPLYGYDPPVSLKPVLHLGNLEIRGEVHVLTVSIPQLMRIKSNPFFEFMMKKIREHTDL
ncbi:MAG: alpha/beta hydrolase [Candidatus Auribacterota bacterium]